MRWQSWLERWRHLITSTGNPQEISEAMRQVNPSITWREWLIAPAYQEAARGEHSLIHTLQKLFKAPYDDPSEELAAKYDQLKPEEFFHAGGISHYSCSS